MARYSRARLTLLLLACALVQSSHGSRPYPGEPQEPGVPSPTMVHGAAEPRRLDARATEVRPSTQEGATGGGHRGANADDDAIAASALGGGRVVPEQRKGSGAPVLPQALGRVLGLGSKLARRVLGGEAAEDSAAGPSCHSNNAHITCAPPAQH